MSREKGPQIVSAAEHAVSDHELTLLLTEVYVGEGFTAPDVAGPAFAPEKVRARGELLFVRSSLGTLAGMVMVVPPWSPACRFAQAHEAELHLLATARQHRGVGIGKALVDAALAHARRGGFETMLLWTQPSMSVAQHLYESAGFQRVPGRDFVAHSRQFLFYERALGR